MTDIETATHGETSNRLKGRRVGSNPALAAPYLTLGHSHNPTPPFWRRLWLRLRGKWPVRYRVTGAVLPGFAQEYNQGPSQWDRQLDPYVMFARSITGKVSFDIETTGAKETLDEYCARDVEMTRRMRIVFTQPAARIEDDGSVVYDPWFWTGRR